MTTKRRRLLKKLVGATVALGVLWTGFSTPARRLLTMPLKIEVPQGQDASVPWSRYVPVTVSWQDARPVSISRVSRLDVHADAYGHYLLHLKLFGWLPFRGLPVDVTKPIFVVPGGESVGVMVHTHGLVVTGFSPIRARDRVVDPAESAGIERGDVILAINGHEARSDQQLKRDTANAGRAHRALQLSVMGARAVHNRRVQPVWSNDRRHWQIGVMVQDRTSGVGTLTFYKPQSLKYAALGHSITDGLTRRPVGISEGRVTGAAIVGIVPSTASTPGQKVGVLSNGTNVSGTVASNGQFGITGGLDHSPRWGSQKPLPLALPDQVHPGPATITTVLKGQTPETFRIEILKTSPQYAPSTKGLLFRVDDPRLLRRTGGVVQGMSGSPIVQDGRLVGAVTHVLVSRPQMGFGCYAYWMGTQSSMRG